MRNTMLTLTARILPAAVLGFLVSLAAPMPAHAQGVRGRSGPMPTAEAAAPIDLTGYWESVVTFDWRYRMVTPRPGDYSDVPLKPAGIKVMDAWDPAKDTAMGLQCKSYGAPGIMRVPEILHITWQDPETLKVQTDAGEQTRLFHFHPSMAAEHGPRTWQGYSVARWQLEGRGGRFFRGGKPAWGSLRVTTTDLRPGYLRKNGIPYSAHTRVLENFDLLQERNGQWLLVVTSTVTDPVYLFEPFITNDNFIKQSSAAGWQPSACSAMW